MAIVRYNRSPSLIDLFQKEIGDLIGENSSAEMTSWKPRVDIQNKNDQYIVYADIPGVDPKDIHVSIEGNMLTIQGERTTEQKEEKEGFSRVERFSGSFYREFSLPENVASEDVTAKCEKGVLKLTIPKRQKQAAKRIEVKEDK